MKLLSTNTEDGEVFFLRGIIIPFTSACLYRFNDKKWVILFWSDEFKAYINEYEESVSYDMYGKSYPIYRSIINNKGLDKLKNFTSVKLKNTKKLRCHIDITIKRKETWNSYYVEAESFLGFKIL